MSTANHKNIYKWVLLRHVGDPNDSFGLHFDLLLQDKEFCRTWRLNKFPELNGSYVKALYINPHKLYWLDIQEKIISGDRGVATRVKKGIFFKALPKKESRFIKLPLIWENTQVELLIDQKGCRILSEKN